MIPYEGEIFDKVLYRKDSIDTWKASLYAGKKTLSGTNSLFCQFVVSTDEPVSEIIPFNENTAILIHTQNKYNDTKDINQLDWDYVYDVLEKCIRKNNRFNFSFLGPIQLFQEAEESSINRDYIDRGLYVLHNGGTIIIHEIETLDDSFLRSNEFTKEKIFDAMNHLYNTDKFFAANCKKIRVWPEEDITISQYNIVLVQMIKTTQKC